MRSRSIIVKLWLAFTTLILVVMVPLELALDRLLTDFYANQATDPLLFHSAQLAEMINLNPESVMLSPMMGRMVGGEVVVLDQAGVPVAFPGQSQLQPPQAAVTAALSGSTYAGLANGYIVTAAPIHHGAAGAVVTLAPAEPIQRSLMQARRYLWLAGGGVLLSGNGLALAIARGLLRPVIAIEHATRQIARGDFSTRVPITSADEIGRLAAEVNRMTEQLQAYENRRREFLANVAHELRTPLSYICGYTQAMAEGLVTNPEDQERYQRIVHEEAVRIGRLVDDLMDLAQMEEGQLGFDTGPLDLRLPVQQALNTIRPLAEEKGMQIDLQLPDSLPLVSGDGGRIQQVVINLLDNALRHTATGGAIRVSAGAGPNFIRVNVADTGPGIAPEHLPLVFERFHKQQSSGRGLGLAIVRSIVRAHGGDVGVDSTPGKGSTFWFQLPVAPEQKPAVH